MPSLANTLICIEDKKENKFVEVTITELIPDSSCQAVHRTELKELVTESSVNLLVLDCAFTTKPELAGLLDRIQRHTPNLLTVLLITEEQKDLLDVVLQRDLFFYVTRPLNNVELRFVFERAARKIFHTKKVKNATSNIQKNLLPGFIGECQVMKRLFDLINMIADDEFSTVLIRGESGTGKELVARAIHAGSQRKKYNFVPVNCAAIPDDLLESELFGHMKGSFTGATQSKQGRIQYADGGTLFLDEIGDMKPSLQAKLLRVLQEKEFEPVGSLKAVPVNTRVLAATHCNLEQLVSEGKFREDLYYRLSVIPLTVPPLRERNEDIPILLEAFINKYTQRRGRDKITFSPQTLAVLSEYEWKGNVRELENLVQHMSILYSGKEIKPDYLPGKYTFSSPGSRFTSEQPDENTTVSSMLDTSNERAELLAVVRPGPPAVDFGDGPVNFNELINEYEKELIIEAMKITTGNKKEAARMLCLKRTTLLEKIKKKELTGLWSN